MIERRQIRSREEWLGWRRFDVTASDVGAVFGLNPHKTRFAVQAEKALGHVDQRENDLMRRGRWMEPAVRLALQEYFPHEEVRAANEYLRDPEVRLGATPDAYLGRRLVETKVISRPVFESWDDELPIYYGLQTLTGMHLDDAPAGLCACLIIDTYSAALEVFHVERNPEAEARIIAGVRQFWAELDDENFEAKPDYAHDGELIRLLYPPRDDVEALVFDGDNRLADILDERERLNAIARDCERRGEEIKAEVLDKLKGASLAWCGPWKIQHKAYHREAKMQPASDYTSLLIHKPKKGRNP